MTLRPSLTPGAATSLLRAHDLTAALAAYRPGTAPRGDHVLNQDAAPLQPWRQAAVLVPVLAEGDRLSVVFTLRTAHLHAHAGQVSFPGGGAEERDRDAVATALRESEEEIGLDPARVEVLGQLDSYITRTGYQVTPVVGLIHGDRPVWRPDEFEVAEIFDVPVPHILTPGVLRLESLSREGAVRRTYVCTWNDYRIWGATAGMLRNLVEVLAP
jgi:8-oxo-dGTP pyrophosphatase MutT (NUDIX family)